MSTFEKQVAIVAALRAVPGESNASIARRIGVNEYTVRRCRKVLELNSVIPTIDVRMGADGVERRLPERVSA